MFDEWTKIECPAFLQLLSAQGIQQGIILVLTDQQLKV